jgi:flavin reductase (DIM6/NTAB) family NADH-FMN oxidoreductase RutF
MQYNFDGPHAEDAYAILASLVVPRPIALVTTMDAMGRLNAAPFSFFNLLGTEPPVVALGIGNRADDTPKDTARNIETTGEFVINLVHPELAEAMNLCSASIPYGQSEIELAGLSTAASFFLKTPRLAEARVALECKLVQTSYIGENRIILGQIHHAYVHADMVDAGTGRIVTEAWAPIGRLASPHWYCQTQPRFEMVRPG